MLIVTFRKISKVPKTCGQFVDRIYSIRLLRDGRGCEGMQKP